MLKQGAHRDSIDGPENSSVQAIAEQNECLRRARAGDGGAFSELIGDFYTPLCSYLARLVGNDELGRDLTQETLIRAWTSLPKLRDEQYFKAWLYGIATNLARSHLRHARLISWLPWAQTEESSSSQILAVEGPETQVSEADIIHKTLARLSPQYRTCLLLQVVGGFSQHDIALSLNISEKSVSSNVYRAREQFRHIYASLKGDTE